MQELKTIEQLINNYRNKRNFNVEDYVAQKCKAINDFFSENGLDAAVLGISGGIDSAVVLYLLHKASIQPDSPIKKILPLSIPIFDVDGVTGQLTAFDNASMVMRKCGYDNEFVNLTDTYEALVKSCITPLDNAAWAEGQMASVLRTPVLYYNAAILQTQGYKSLVVGTTNRDEGSYIGFFGKASDAMVDLQIIGDLHKSEVYKVAKFLKVPKPIRKATPKGDVWDSKVDEEMIGCDYDFLEMYTGYFLNKSLDLFSIIYSLDENQKNIFYKKSEAIEKIHNTNKHKYQVGNPAHFIDVLERKVLGGW